MRKHAKKERADLREVVCRTLDISPDALPRTGSIEIRGHHSVSVKEGGRILTYTPSEVSVEFDRGVVSIYGKRLVCSAYCRGTVRIDGRISSVVFGEI